MTMTKPNWQERIEGMKQPFKVSENMELRDSYNQAIDDLIPIIAEEMQKQREDLIFEIRRHTFSDDTPVNNTQCILGDKLSAFKDKE